MFTLPPAGIPGERFRIGVLSVLCAIGFSCFSAILVISGIQRVRVGIRVLQTPPSEYIETPENFCKQFDTTPFESHCVPLHPFRDGILLGTWITGVGLIFVDLVLCVGISYAYSLATGGFRELQHIAAAGSPSIDPPDGFSNFMIGIIRIISVPTFIAGFCWMPLAGLERIRRGLNILAHPRDPTVETLEAYCTRHYEKPSEYYCVSARPIVNGLIPGVLGVLAGVLVPILTAWVFFQRYVAADR